MDQEWTPKLLKDLKVYVTIGFQVLGEKKLRPQSPQLISERSRFAHDCEFFIFSMNILENIQVVIAILVWVSLVETLMDHVTLVSKIPARVVKKIS
jgi:hypothetical protein